MDLQRERLASLLRISPVPPAPVVTVLEGVAEEGYSRERIRYPCREGDVAEAFVFRPVHGEACGAVLALHQHNSQWDIGKTEIAGLAGDPLQAFGPALARCGVIVLAPDAVGFESRTKPAIGDLSMAPPLHRPYSSADGWLQFYNEMAHRIVQGDLLMRKALDDCRVALSVLATLSDHAKLGALGHSFGGTLSLFLAALDLRVAFACCSGAACSLKHKLAHGKALDMALVIPGFAKVLDLDDVMRCVAPRPLFIVSADADPHSADAEDLVQSARPVFQAQGASSDLRHLRVSGSHALDPERFNAIVTWTVERCQAV